MAEDGGFHFLDGQLQLTVASTVPFLKQCGTDARNNLPIAGERINVTVWDPATKMSVNILHVLRLGAVDVAREVEVVVVLRTGDFADGHKARVARDFDLLCERINNLVDVLLTKAVLVAIFDEAFGGVDHKDALPSGGAFLIDHH